MGVKLSLDELKQRIFKVHGDTYIYDYTTFKTVKENIKVICREHGDFTVRLESHINGKICPNCIKKRVSDKYRLKSVVNKLEQLSKIQQPDDYKLIPLSKGRFTKIDNEDFERVIKYSWYFSNNYGWNDCVGAMHRFIMDCPEDKVIDHDNMDKLDNRKFNLRVCVKSENEVAKPKSKSRDYSSKYKGVHWSKHLKYWVAQIKKGSARLHLGYFKDEIECAKARDVKALELFGEFAYLNFPEKKEEYLKIIRKSQK